MEKCIFVRKEDKQKHTLHALRNMRTETITTIDKK